MRSLHFQRVLGAGAFGTVYLADLAGAHGFRRAVAVKVLLNTQSDGIDFLGRVRDEARLLGLLQDEHILKVLELIRIEGRDSVIMEYVEGVDMGVLGAAGARPPPRAIAELGAMVASALHQAHTAVHPATGQAMNVIHRDVKPANIMVTRTGGVKLLDFGVARARFEARETKTGQFVLGTLNYMAPEYIVTGEVSPRADIYGLALTLWESIIGEVFGQPRLKAEQHEARLKERLARLPAQYGPLLPIFQQMLAWNATSRPDGAEVERMLTAATDSLQGPGLRSWSGEWVTKILSARQQDPQQQSQDILGLQGKSISLKDTAPEDSLDGLELSKLPPKEPPSPPIATSKTGPQPPKKTNPQLKPKQTPKKKTSLDWKVIAFQAILLGTAFVVLVLLLFMALYLLSVFL